MARVDDATLDEIRARVRIEDIVGRSVVLKPDGSGRMKGLCPFHDEKSPSFKVDKSRGRYHCYGCEADGDVFEFVQQAEQLSFREAVEALAEKAGVTLAEADPELEQKRRAHQRLREAVAAATEFYQQALLSPEAAHARRELTNRGFGRDHAETHGCGWAPPAGGTALVGHLHAAGYTDKELVSAGLATADRNGRTRDFFRDRLLWPIADSSGRTVGFSGRRLGESQTGGKYVNSPATSLFTKSQLLYRLHPARRLAAKTGRLFVVEGYTDVMAVESVGQAAVATCGTALTEDHVKLLARLLPEHVEVVFAFDSDSAGVAATTRAWQRAQPLLDRARAATLSGGDPCDIWTADAAELAGQLETTTPLTEAVLRSVVATELSDQPTPESRVRAGKAAVALLRQATADNDLIVDGYRPLIAELTGLESIPPSWWDTEPQPSPAGPPSSTHGQEEEPPPPPPEFAAPRRNRGRDSRQVLREQDFWGLVLATGTHWLDVVDRTWFVTDPGTALWTALAAAEHDWNKLPPSARQWAADRPVPADEGAEVVTQLHLAHLRRRNAELRLIMEGAATSDEVDAAAAAMAEIRRVLHDMGTR